MYRKLSNAKEGGSIMKLDGGTKKCYCVPIWKYFVALI